MCRSFLGGILYYTLCDGQQAVYGPIHFDNIPYNFCKLIEYIIHPQVMYDLYVVKMDLSNLFRNHYLYCVFFNGYVLEQPDHFTIVFR